VLKMVHSEGSILNFPQRGFLGIIVKFTTWPMLTSRTIITETGFYEAYRRIWLTCFISQIVRMLSVYFVNVDNFNAIDLSNSDVKETT